MALGLLAGCSGAQSALDSHSGQACHLASLFWLFTIVGGLIWVLVVAALFIIIARQRGASALLAGSATAKDSHCRWLCRTWLDDDVSRARPKKGFRGPVAARRLRAAWRAYEQFKGNPKSD